MKAHCLRVWHETDGVLSFEWILLLTLLTIGIVSGVAAARDAIIDELGDIAQAAQGIDQSYSLAGVSLDLDGDPMTIEFTAASSVFVEGPEDAAFQDCARGTAPSGQGTESDL